MTVQARVVSLLPGQRRDKALGVVEYIAVYIIITVVVVIAPRVCVCVCVFVCV